MAHCVVLREKNIKTLWVVRIHFLNKKFLQSLSCGMYARATSEEDVQAFLQEANK